MAFDALCRAVLPFKRKLRLAVVKRYVPPAFNCVTGFASTLVHQFLYFTVVRIAVTGGAGRLLEHESRTSHSVGISSDMAGNTWDGKVGSTERIVGLFMLSDSIVGGREPLHRMALLARSFLRPFGKGPVVEIGVAIGAVGKFERDLFLARDMAFTALHGGMFSEERITCFAMVEFVAADVVPAIRGVARFAIRAQ